MDKAVTHDTAQQIRHQVICARDSQFRIRSLVSHELDIRIQGAVGKGYISQFYRQDLKRACFGKIRLVLHARHRQAGCKDKQGYDSFHRFVIIYNRYSYAREEVGGTSYL